MSNIERIFDFGCGYGRVTRYFRSAFPEAEVHVTDFDARGVQFCVEQFQCLDTQGGIAENFYDLIFLGSVFTHLPSQTVSQLLPLLLKALRPNGVLIFTTQGRFPVERMRGFDWENDKGRSWMHYNLEREAFEKLVRMFQETDYGFVDYPKRTGYGVAIASPFWYSREILKNTSFIQILLQEKGFDNHQDVSAFMRADVADLAKGPLFFARG
ncbi:class I SAM-dependent methyltransferase [Rhodoblastus acidophilus]|nr:class I SAM-dependent methyltransferase [Rhodoblastus acidophilus]